MSASRSSSNGQLHAEDGILKVYIRKLDQLFDSMDPSPFHEKGLDSHADEYIVAAAKELPGGAPTALVIYLDQSAGLPEDERVLEDAVRRHYARASQLLRWELRRLLRRGSISLVIGITVLAAALAAGEYLTRLLGGGHLATVLGQSLHIGGWVAMWHPMEIFLYEWWPILSERKLYDRLSRIPVRIVYTANQPADADIEVVDSGSVPRSNSHPNERIASEVTHGVYSGRRDVR